MTRGPALIRGASGREVQVTARRFLARHRQSLLGHASFQLAARVYTAAAQLVGFALVGALGADRLVAIYALGMATAGLVATAVDMGCGLWIVRRVAAGDDLPRLTVPRVLMFSISALGVWGASVAGLVPVTAVPWVLIAGTTMGCSGLWRGVLWGRLRHDKEALAATAQSTALVAGLGLALLLRAGDASIPLVAAAAACALGYAARVYMGRGMVRRRRGLMGMKEWLREVYSYAGQAVVTSAQTQADLLLLGALWTGPAAGVAAYGVTMRCYYAAGMPFEALGTAVLPRVAMNRTIGWGRLFKIAVPVAVVALLVMLGLTSSGTLFGLSPAASVYLKSVGCILLVALPFRFASYILAAVVTGSGNQSARFMAAALGLATMLALDVWLIPLKGPTGAAIALVCADVVLVIGYAWAARRALRSGGP